MLPTRKSVPRSSRQSDHTKTSRKMKWYRQVSRSSGLAKAILQGTMKRGRRQGRQKNGGKTSSGNRQAWSSPSPRGQWGTEKNGGNRLWSHLGCPTDPHGKGVGEGEGVRRCCCSTSSLGCCSCFLLMMLFFSSCSHGFTFTWWGCCCYVFDIYQPSLPTPFCSVLVSVSVFMALSTVFYSINSPDNSPLPHSVLPLLFLPYWSFQLIFLFMKVSLSPDIILCGWLGLKNQLTNNSSLLVWFCIVVGYVAVVIYCYFSSCSVIVSLLFFCCCFFPLFLPPPFDLE